MRKEKRDVAVRKPVFAAIINKRPNTCVYVSVCVCVCVCVGGCAINSDDE